MPRLLRCVRCGRLTAPQAAPFQDVPLCEPHFSASNVSSLAGEVNTETTWYTATGSMPATLVGFGEFHGDVGLHLEHGGIDWWVRLLDMGGCA